MKIIYLLITMTGLLVALPGFSSDCVDFTGAWKGKCKPALSESEGVPVKINIQQYKSCNYLDILTSVEGSPNDSSVLIPGGSSEVKRNYPNGDLIADLTTPTWNEPKTVLTIKNDRIGHMKKEGKEEIYQLNTVNTLEIKDGKLVLTSMLAPGTTVSSICTLEKQ